MKRFLGSAVAIFAAFCLLTAPCGAESVSVAKENESVQLSLPCKSAILIEQTTGQVLYSHNPDEALPIASVTKVMTLLLTMEALSHGTLSLEGAVPISENAASMGGSQAYLEPGEEITLHEVLKAVFISSANDGAVALAELISGNVDAFVAAMNDKAKALGMENTLFCNPTGLDDGETGYASARDVALMSRALLDFDEIYPYTTTWIDSIRDGAFGLANTNKLIRFYHGATGLKTGSTGKAKYCLSASAERNGLKLCAVVLAADSSADRFQAARTLLDFGFATYAYFTPEKLSLPSIPVWKGTKAQLSCTAPEEGVLLEKAEASGLTATLQLPEELHAPVAKGQVLGSIEYRKDGKVIFQIPVLAAEEIPELDFPTLLLRLLRLFFAGR